MAEQTRKHPDPPAEVPTGVPCSAWAAGRPELTVPVAGLLADDPELHDAVLSPEQWEKRLTQYRESPRP